MSDSHQAQASTDAAPESGSDIPSFEALAADPEIAALLDFRPVPRKRDVPDGWTPDRQREFIARLTTHGGVGRAADETGKTETSVRKLYRSPLAGAFRASWHAAIELAKARLEQEAPEGPPPMARAPSIDHRFKHPRAGSGGASDEAPGGGEGSGGDFAGDEAKDRISGKLLRARRLYLFEISESPGKRAAFEILAGFPIDWDKARRMEAQADEPFRGPNFREPDMLLTAENGWLGEMAHGPDKRAELLRMLNDYRVEHGMEPIEWGEGEGEGEE